MRAGRASSRGTTRGCDDVELRSERWPGLALGWLARLVLLLHVQLLVPAVDRPVAEVDHGVGDVPAPIRILGDRVVDAEGHGRLDRADVHVDGVPGTQPERAQD